MNRPVQGLAAKAMLVTLTVRSWTARKHDKTVSREVDDKHGAHDGGRFNKLLIDKAHLAPINKAEGALRDYHYSVTMPWGDKNDRLLPSKLYLDYMARISALREDFEREVNIFVREYPKLQQAAAKRLGTMYSSADYPSSIRDRFGVSIDFSVLPTAGDIRVDVDTDHIDRLRADVEATAAKRTRELVTNCWERVHDVVGKMHERLKDPKAIFRDSLITNAQELADLLPALNITNDPELDKATQQLRNLLHAPETLRADHVLRATVASEADDMLARMAGRLPSKAA